MTNLSIDDIKKIADLAKIEVSENDVANFLVDINNILTHLSSVKDAKDNSTQVDFLTTNNAREDVLEPRDFDKDTIFSDMPNKSKDNQVKVSKVIKK